jgi:hypothetical protein
MTKVDAQNWKIKNLPPRCTSEASSSPVILSMPATCTEAALGDADVSPAAPHPLHEREPRGNSRPHTRQYTMPPPDCCYSDPRTLVCFLFVCLAKDSLGRVGCQPQRGNISRLIPGAVCRTGSGRREGQSSRSAVRPGNRSSPQEPENTGIPELTR